MVTVSGNTGSAPLVGFEVIQDGASSGPIGREKGSSDVKSDASYARFEAEQTPNGVKRHF